MERIIILSLFPIRVRSFPEFDNGHFDIAAEPGIISAALTEANLFQYMVSTVRFRWWIPAIAVALLATSIYPRRTIQFILCMQTPVNQVATVDAESRQLLAVAPDIRKTDSTWGPYTGPNNMLKIENVFDTVSSRILFSSAWMTCVVRNPLHQRTSIRYPVEPKFPPQFCPRVVGEVPLSSQRMIPDDRPGI
jgi:hypothetical protein